MIYSLEFIGDGDSSVYYSLIAGVPILILQR